MHFKSIAAACLLFASGACALIYEVVWARQLGVHLGRTAVAQAAVVATFMAGLGLGYLLVARRVDRLRRPLLIYGGLELLVAAWCMATPWLLPSLAALAGAGMVGQLSVAVAIMAVPTVCMGATLPVLVAGLGPGPERGGRVLALLYAANSAGAVAGALLAGYLFIERLGLSLSIQVAAGVNGLVALAALALASVPTLVSVPSQAATDAETSVPPEAAGAALSLRRLWGIAALVGCATLALQAGWFRIFGVVLGSSTHSFALVVAAFVGGIAIGSALLRFWLDRWGASRHTLALCAIAGGVLVFAGLPAMPSLPWWFTRLRGLVADSGGGWSMVEMAKAALVFALVALPAALFGAVLPLTGRLAMDRGGASGRSTAGAFAASTAGSVVGAALGGTWAVPALGLAGVLQAGAAALVLAGLWALPWPARQSESGRGAGRSRALAVIGGLALLAIAFIPMDWDPRLLSAGAFRGKPSQAPTKAVWQARWQREEVRFHRDGADATVTVLERKGRRVLKINGKPDASNRGDMLTQVASAHIPMLLHSNPARVLIIGLGSGVSVGSAALHGAEIDVLEISQAVVDGSRLFDQDSGAPLDQKNVHLWRADARSWLTHNDGPWQVIISEPSNPWMAGGGSLFTTEAFQLARDRLTPGGLLAQWFHCYEMNDDLLALVIRTLRSVFPHVAIWELYPEDLLLIASMEPIQPDLDAIASRVLEAGIAADLARVGVAGPATLLSLQAMTSAQVGELTGDGPLHHDDWPILEHRATRSLLAGSHARLVRRHDARRWPLEGSGLVLSRWLKEHPLTAPEAQALFTLHTRFPAAPAAFRLGLVEGLANGDDGEFLIDLLFTLTREAHFEHAEKVALSLMQKVPHVPRALLAVADLRLRQTKLGGDGSDVAARTAHHLLRRCVTLGDSRGRCKASLGNMAKVQ